MVVRIISSLILMYRIVGVIDQKTEWIQHSLPLLKRGEGVTILLDSTQITDPPELSGRPVTICKPEGDRVRFIAHSVQVRNNIVGIFIKGIFSDQIPDGSHIRW